MRSWIGATVALAAVVRIVNVRRQSSSPARHDSYSPASRIRPPSGRWNQTGCRADFGPVHSKKPSAGTRQRRPFSHAVRYARRRGTSSARALICAPARLASVAQRLTSPHRAGSACRSSRRSRTMMCGCVGAML